MRNSTRSLGTYGGLRRCDGMLGKDQIMHQLDLIVCTELTLPRNKTLCRLPLTNENSRLEENPTYRKLNFSRRDGMGFDMRCQGVSKIGERLQACFRNKLQTGTKERSPFVGIGCTGKTL